MSSSIATFVRDGGRSSKKISKTLCRTDTHVSYPCLSWNLSSQAWTNESAVWVLYCRVILVFSGSDFFQTSNDLELWQACVQLAPLSLRALINSKDFFSSESLHIAAPTASTSKVVRLSGCNTSYWKPEAMHFRALSNLRVSRNVQNTPMRSADIESFPIQCWHLSSWGSLIHFSKASWSKTSDGRDQLRFLYIWVNFWTNSILYFFHLTYLPSKR